MWDWLTAGPWLSSHAGFRGFRRVGDSGGEPWIPKLARLAERETGFLLHCLTLYDCRTEVIIMRKPSKLCMLDRRGIYSQPSLWALATLSRRMSRLNSPLALSYRSEM